MLDFIKSVVQYVKNRVDYIDKKAISGETANSMADYVKDQIYANNAKYLVETATSAPTANSMAARIETIETNTGVVLKTACYWSILQILQAGAGNTTATYTAPAGGAKLTAMCLSNSSLDLAITVTVNGTVFINAQAVYGITDIGSHVWNISPHYIQLAEGNTITLYGSAGGAGNRYATLSLSFIV